MVPFLKMRAFICKLSLRFDFMFDHPSLVFDQSKKAKYSLFLLFEFISN